MQRGKIKHWNTEKAFGFISGDDGQDVFFHKKALIQSGTALNLGDAVLYETSMQRDGRLRAHRVERA